MLRFFLWGPLKSRIATQNFPSHFTYCYGLRALSPTFHLPHDSGPLSFYPMKWMAKMVQYHLFLKFLATKHCFGNYWGSTTFFGTRVWWARVPYFLIHRDMMTWKIEIKIFCLVLEHVKLEYHLFISCYCNNLHVSFSPNY